jgi:hypothetical protein
VGLLLLSGLRGEPVPEGHVALVPAERVLDLLGGKGSWGGCHHGLQ